MAEEEQMDVTSLGSQAKKKKGKKKQKKKQRAPESSVYIPGEGQLDEDEELIVDESAYIMLHQATTGDPCLSFEVLRDGLGDRSAYPHTSYLVGGTQSEAGHFNYILLMKMQNLHKTQKEEKSKDKEEEEDEEDSETSDDEDDEGESGESSKKPQLVQTFIKHSGCVNRIKCTQVNNHTLSASWSEQGVVYVHDVTPYLNVLDTPAAIPEFENTNNQNASQLYAFSGHQIEGYALAWSKLDPGRLLSGDCNKNIFLWKPTESSWEVDARPFVGHTASVEDIEWSPKENNVFMTCSVDKSLRVWDARAQPAKACKLVNSEAHMRDINVISWSQHEPLVISGGDDGIIKIWDLRKFNTGVAVASFDHHKGPITSVEWNPLESSVFAAAGSDDQLTLWDVAVERDESQIAEEEPDIPAQLLFIHMGQKDIKEIHWHPQIPGVMFSTAQSGFNIFQTISV